LAIEETKDLTNLKMDDLHGILIVHEMRTNDSKAVKKEEAFKDDKESQVKKIKYDFDMEIYDEKVKSMFVRKLKRGS
ncbi:hypothetical protein KI387_013575, partial [Taxus chinensis]